MNSTIIKQFQVAQKQFNEERNKEEGSQVMNKIIALVNELGQNFTVLDGGQLEEKRMKLAGYKFYLADYVSDLNRISESLKLEIKYISASSWDTVVEEIKAVEGRVKNKEQVENVILIKTKDQRNEQILYETMYYKYKMKLSAVDDILSAIMQRVAQLKRLIEQSK